MRETVSARCVFRGDPCVAICYVNELIVLAENPKRIEIWKELLDRKQVLKDLGKPTLFPGMEISWGPNSVKPSQKAIIKRFLDKNGMPNLNSEGSPMDVRVIINEDDEVQLNAEEASKVRGIVGSLLYIALKIRSDLCMAGAGLRQIFKIQGTRT